MPGKIRLDVIREIRKKKRSSASGGGSIAQHRKPDNGIGRRLLGVVGHQAIWHFDLVVPDLQQAANSVNSMQGIWFFLCISITALSLFSLTELRRSVFFSSSANRMGGYSSLSRNIRLTSIPNIKRVVITPLLSLGSAF